MPWHPFLVHFPIAGWFFGCVLLWLALIAKKPGWRDGGWWCLLLAALFAIGAAVTGQNEYQELVGVVEAGQGAVEPAAANVDLERHRDLGNLLPWLMCALVLLRGHTLFAKQSFALPDWLWAVVASAIAGLIFYVGHLGGRIVYLWSLTGANGGF